MKKILLTLILGMFLISFVSAEIQTLGIFKQGEDINLIQICTSCSFNNITLILDPNGNQVIGEFGMTKLGTVYNFTLTSDNITTFGKYTVHGFGDLDGSNTIWSYYFTMTESGTELTSSSNLTLGLLAILVLFFFGSLFVMFNVENYIAKFSLYWVSHLLLILISFVGWQIGVEGLLIGTAITGIFRILFWIFIVSAFPMLILSIAWIVYIHLFNEHFQKLIDKGEDPETAFSMTKKKHGGWFSGK